MQVEPQEASSAKATTERTRPTMASKRLDLPSVCDICGKGRSSGKHASCSRKRQQIKTSEWASYMANIEAKKAEKDRKAR